MRNLIEDFLMVIGLGLAILLGFSQFMNGQVQELQKPQSVQVVQATGGTTAATVYNNNEYLWYSASHSNVFRATTTMTQMDSSEFTVVMWVRRVYELAEDRNYLFDFRSDDGTGHGRGHVYVWCNNVPANNGLLDYDTNGDAYVDNVLDARWPDDGGWHLIVISGMRIEGTILDFSVGNFLGNIFRGSWDQFAIFDDAMTTTEITAIYDAGLGADMRDLEEDIDNNLLYYLTFNTEGSNAENGTTVEPVVGSGTLTTISSITKYRDHWSNNSSIRLTDGYLTSTCTSLDGTYSVMVWMRSEEGETATGNHFIFDARESSGQGYINWRPASATWTKGTGGLAKFDGVQTNVTNNDNAWHHMGNAGATLDITVDIDFGRANTGGSYFNGYLDEIIVYSGTLSTDDYDFMYNSGIPRDPTDMDAQWGNIVHYWDFESVTGSTVPDRVGSCDLTIVQGGVISTEVAKPEIDLFFDYVASAQLHLWFNWDSLAQLGTPPPTGEIYPEVYKGGAIWNTDTDVTTTDLEWRIHPTATSGWQTTEPEGWQYVDVGSANVTYMKYNNSGQQVYQDSLWPDDDAYILIFGIHDPDPGSGASEVGSFFAGPSGTGGSTDMDFYMQGDGDLGFILDEGATTETIHYTGTAFDDSTAQYGFAWVPGDSAYIFVNGEKVYSAETALTDINPSTSDARVHIGILNQGPNSDHLDGTHSYFRIIKTDPDSLHYKWKELFRAHFNYYKDQLGY